MRKSFSSETKRQLAETELKKRCCRYIYNAVADFAAGGGGTLDGIYGKCRCEACPAAFLRALFVAYGSVTDPAKAYHLDLSFPDPGTRDEAHSIVQEAGFEFGRSVRRQGGHERYIIYTKNSSVIEDFLAYTGASSAVFAIMNSKIMGELRNSANRVVNCDTANI